MTSTRNKDKNATVSQTGYNTVNQNHEDMTANSSNTDGNEILVMAQQMAANMHIQQARPIKSYHMPLGSDTFDKLQASNIESKMQIGQRNGSATGDIPITALQRRFP